MSNRDLWKNVDALLEQSGWLTGLARHLARSPDLGADAVQDTWVACLDRPPPAGASVRAWLGGILRNRVRMRFRGDGRRRRYERDAAVVPAAAVPSPEAAFERLEAQRLLVEAVGALPDPYRTTVLLRYFEGMTAEAIAHAQGVPAGTVRWRLKEALDRIRAALDHRHGGERHVWVGALGALDFASPTAPPPRPGMPLVVVAKVAVALVMLLTLALVARSWSGRAMGPGGVPTPSDLRAQAAASGPLRLTAATVAAVPRGRLAGHVRDPGGKTVSGAVVLLWGSIAGPGNTWTLLERLAHSGRDGAFAFADVPPGHHVVTATRAGFRPAFRAGTWERTAPSEDTFDLTLGRAGVTLSGEARDAGDGPVVEAWVMAQARSGFIYSGSRFVTVTDAAGTYQLTLEPGAYLVSVRKDGYVRHAEDVSVTRDETRVFRLDPASRASGTAVDVHGAPVVGAAVSIEDGPGGAQRTETNASGAFSFDGLARGRYRLVARSEAGTVGQLAIDLGVATRVTDLEVKMGPGAVVKGQVKTSAGRPVADAELRLHGSLFDVGEGRPVGRSAADGQFRVSGLLPGRHVLAVVAAGLAPDRREVVIADGADDAGDLDFALPAAASLSGQIVSGSGAPQARALVQAWVTAGSPRRTVSFHKIRSDADGRFRIEGVAPGLLQVQGDAPAAGLTVVGFPLGAGESREVRLTLAAGSVVSGRVRLPSGGPAAGVSVMAQGAGVPVSRTALTAEDGSFQIGRFARGAVRLILRPTAPANTPPLPPLIKDVTVDGATAIDGVELRLPASTDLPRTAQSGIR